MNKKSFKLFANCKTVKGVNKATICDLHRGKVYSIPNELAIFLEKAGDKDTLEYIHKEASDEKETILEYLDYLEENELGFWTDEPERFPEMDLKWKSSEYINNAIIELEELENNELKKITTALKNLLCKYIELRFYKKVDLNKINFFMNECAQSTIRSVIIYLPDSLDLKIDDVENLLQNHSRIALIVLHSYNKKKSNFLKSNSRIKTISRKIDNREHCGLIDPRLFTIKIPVFTESLKFNTCLNKKLGIDINGDIKNCPSMPSSYGNVKTDSIENIVNSKSFKKNWGIHKDLVETCKDCEYRRVCTDCRAYIEDPNDPYSKPLKCGYNPYSNEWQDWSKNPLKKKTVDYYSRRDSLI